MFPRTYPSGLGDIYFAYLNFFEFTWFLFARTRLTLKFYPKMVTLMNIAFFVYINSYAYAASIQFLVFTISLNVMVLVYFLSKSEMAAAQSWTPFDQNTPSLGRPRIGYHDVLNDTNYGTGLYLWSAFMPLRGRSFFSQTQISEGDQLSEYNRYFLTYNPRRIANMERMQQRQRQRPQHERPVIGEPPVALGGDDPVPEPEDLVEVGAVNPQVDGDVENNNNNAVGNDNNDIEMRQL